MAARKNVKTDDNANDTVKADALADLLDEVNEVVEKSKEEDRAEEVGETPVNEKDTPDVTVVFTPSAEAEIAEVAPVQIAVHPTDDLSVPVEPDEDELVVDESVESEAKPDTTEFQNWVANNPYADAKELAAAVRKLN